MLSMICEQHRGSDISVTRVFPVPSPSMPLSRGIDVIVDELQACKINSGHLQYTAQQLDSISICASKALHHGDLPEVRDPYSEAALRHGTRPTPRVCAGTPDTNKGNNPADDE
jgi:hypothetical protein